MARHRGGLSTDGAGRCWQAGDGSSGGRSAAAAAWAGLPCRALALGGSCGGVRGPTAPSPQAVVMATSGAWDLSRTRHRVCTRGLGLLTDRPRPRRGTAAAVTPYPEPAPVTALAFPASCSGHWERLSWPGPTQEHHHTGAAPITCHGWPQLPTETHACPCVPESAKPGVCELTRNEGKWLL